jgi:hypothetical protein
MCRFTAGMATSPVLLADVLLRTPHSFFVNRVGAGGRGHRRRRAFRRIVSQLASDRTLGSGRRPENAARCAVLCSQAPLIQTAVGRADLYNYLKVRVRRARVHGRPAGALTLQRRRGRPAQRRRQLRWLW